MPHQAPPHLQIARASAPVTGEDRPCPWWRHIVGTSTMSAAAGVVLAVNGAAGREVLPDPLETISVTAAICAWVLHVVGRAECRTKQRQELILAQLERMELKADAYHEHWRTRAKEAGFAEGYLARAVEDNPDLPQPEGATVRMIHRPGRTG